MGLMSSSLRIRRTVKKKMETNMGLFMSIQKIGAPDEIQDNYPAPEPPPNQRSEILSDNDCQNTDIIASQVHASPDETMEDLVDRLTKPFTSDVLQVRAIFRWIGLQTLNEYLYPAGAHPTSSSHYLRNLSKKTLSYASLFTIMCRYAGIPCMAIKGIAKSAAYEVGEQDIDDLRNVWNAVYVAGGWRLVFPLWAFSAVVGRSTGSWTLVESKGCSVNERENSFDGVTIKNINEYYFFTDPNQLIYRCFPDNERWQLIQKPISKCQFIKMPYLRPNYFKHRLTILSTFENTLKSENGFCQIVFKHTDVGNVVGLSYELYYNHSESQNGNYRGLSLYRFVAIMNEEDKTYFNMRLPISGIYKLQILDFDQEWISFFKIVSEKAMTNCEPFPINAPLGFGPCRKTLQAGLSFQSHKRGEIFVHRKDVIEIKFTKTRPVLISTLLVHNSIPSNRLQRYVNVKTIFQEILIKVQIPVNGEYALIINTKEGDAEEGASFNNACNYLLTTGSSKNKNRHWETAREKMVRKNLKKALHGRNANLIQIALNKFQDMNLDDLGEIENANNRIDFLTHFNALTDGINRRHVDMLEQAVVNAKTSKYSEELQSRIEDAETLLQQLRNLKPFTHDVLDMKHAISELHRYQVPKQVVHDVMKATFLLLGESEQQTQDWSFLRAEIRKTGKVSLLRRIRNFEINTVTIKTINKVKDLLLPYNKEMVTANSAGAGTFFLWIQSVVNDLVLNHS